MRVISASAANRKSRSRAISDEVQVSKNEFSKQFWGTTSNAFLDSNLHGGHGESPHAICLPKRLFASPWGAVGATHQTVLERGTAEHSDRPHRGQASAAKSKPPELGPSGPRWTRCDNRRNFLYNRSNCLTINPYTGIRETTHFSNRSG
ncbi:MAG: hypothetical protein JW384_01562 [Nitrosomonadaceae bacterium]|nr:hypothetical protein [Nitrosomonadaceae bacterium]